MIEIIPNWHPLLVHFTVGLLTTSVLFYLASAVLSHTNSWKQQWLNMANWSLWSGCLFAIATAIAGWLAYNSVAHDSASHAAMTLHRNWALPTASTFLLLGLWAIFIARKNRRPGFLFLTFSTIAAGLLMVTGWLGAEAVYRYGLGVKSLPVVTEGADGHNHSHGTEHDEPVMGEGEHQHGTTESEKPLAEGTHQHNHENKETLPETEQLLKQDGHQHEHKTNSLPGITGGADGHNHSHGTEHDESALDEDKHQHGTTESEKPLAEAAHQHNHENKETLPETAQPLKQDGHNHSHGAEHDESAMGEGEHQHGTTESKKPLTEGAHQHSHENKKTLPETEQPLKQDGHQHEHKTENSLSKIEQINNTIEHAHKTMTDDNTELTIQPSDTKSHVHDSNTIEPIATPLGQDNTSEGMPISSPSELHSSYHTEKQNEGAVNKETHSHDHDHKH